MGGPLHPGRRSVLRRWYYRFRIRVRRFRRNDQVVLTVLAVLVGAAAAYGAIGFRYLIGTIQFLAFGSASPRLWTVVADLPWWQVLLVPSLGGLLIGLFVRYVMAEQRPVGVADVIEARLHKGGRMPLATALLGALTNAASLGVGGSAGREGPVVHIGASIAAWVASRLRLSPTMGRTLLGCGAAAAVAASFNAPIAGAFFALEVVVGHYALGAFAPIVIASVVGTVISRSVFGDFPAFIVPEYAVSSVWEFGAFALLGVASAAAALIFMRSIMGVQDLAEKIPGPVWLRPALGGLAVGAIGLAYPQVLGVGYETTDAALKTQFTLALLLPLLAAKIAATAITLGSGFGGGVFSPSLVVGALLGGIFGSVMVGLYPAVATSAGAYTMVGMGAVAGAVLGAPVSTILIIFELTHDYKITLAVMLAVALASVITHQLHGKSFFAWQLSRRGVRVDQGQGRSLLRGQPVREVMDRAIETVSPAAGVGDLRRLLLDAPGGMLFVVDSERRLTGTITLAQLSAAAFDTTLDALVRAADIARPDPPMLEVDENLEIAMEAFADMDEPWIAVVENREDRKLLGVVHERDVLLAYQRALLRARAEERGET